MRRCTSNSINRTKIGEASQCGKHSNQQFQIQYDRSSIHSSSEFEWQSFEIVEQQSVREDQLTRSARSVRQCAYRSESVHRRLAIDLKFENAEFVKQLVPQRTERRFRRSEQFSIA